MNLSWLELAIIGLATYRLALLLSSDTGPYGVFTKLRSYLKREAQHNKPLRQSKVHLGIDCIKCVPHWVAFPIVAFVFSVEQLPQWLALAGWSFLLWNALSAIAILINRALPPKA